ncbi:MAG: carbohydrate ABC transporter permease [Desulfurococcales archaeon]|nr:carbohydrate ABC transporter permease [Desulfurococcales archaeon]
MRSPIMQALTGIAKAWFILLLASWIGLPIAVAMIYAVSDRDAIYEPTPIPLEYSLRQLQELWYLGAGSAIVNSVIVALLTIAISFALGVPAGYAFARYVFPGKDFLKLLIIGLRMFPIIVIAVPLATLYIRLGLSDSLLGLALAHSAMSIPFVVLITSGVFAGVSRELEEAGMVFGLDPLGVFLRITIPLALPGLAAAAMFTFLMSWNEVFIASILTTTNRPLSAFILSTALTAPDYYKFAGTLIIILPALVFVFITRRYLIAIWGITVR